MPTPFDHPAKPHQLLLFDNSGHYRQPLTAALTAASISVEIEEVNAALAFRLALAREWDMILVAYAIAEAALPILSQVAPEQTIILLYAPHEEEQAFTLTTEAISDLVSGAALRRLPLILRREWKLKESQTNAQRLRQLETRFHAIVEGFGDTILIADADQLIRYANAAFGRSFGYRLSQLLGQPFATLLPAADRALFQENLVQLLSAIGTIETIAHRLQRANGDWAFVETTGHTLQDPAGQFFLVLHVRDVSDRRRTEAALLESEQRLRLFIEHAPAAIAMLDQHMNYLSVSRRWLADYRLYEGDIIGRSHYEIFPDLPAHWREIHQRCLQGAVEKREADAFPRQDGTVDWVRWEIRPWRNIYNEIGGLILFSEVITARKQAEAAQHEQRLLAETMRDSLAVLTSTLDVEAVMQRILTLSAQVVPSEAGAIVLFAEHEGRVAYARGHAPQAEAFFNTNPITFNVEVYTKDQNDQLYYLVTDTKLAPGWVTFPTTEWIRSSIGVPIVIHGKPIGLLTADSRTPNQYGQKDVQNLQTFARYAALALENAHHVTHLEQRVQARTGELQATKTQVEAILDNSPDGILLINADLTIQQANHAFHQLFACEPAECHGQSLLERIDQADIAQVKALLQTAITTTQHNQLEIHALRKDGTSFDAELSVGLIKDDGLVCVIRDITERKTQERQLRYHASLQKTVSDAVIVTDMASRVQSWNPAAERIYGWRAAEAAGRTMGELVHTQFAFPEERAYLLERLQAQGWWYGEFIQQRKDGQICHVLSSAALVNDEQGNPIGMVAVNHDITERKQAEDALQKSAAEIHDLYHNAPCGYHSLDKDGLIIQINDTELRWLGYQREEIVGKYKLTDLFTAESILTFQKNFPLFKARGWVNDLEFDLFAKDGSIRHVLLNSSAIYDQAGNYVQSRSTLFDITDLRLAQEKIIESEARYRLIAENITDVIIKADATGQITFTTPSCYAATGYRPEELIGHSRNFFVHPDDVPNSLAVIQSAINSSATSYVLTYRIRHKAGHYIWVESTATIIRNAESGTVVEFVSMLRDITERKQADLTQQASEAKYRQLVETMRGGLVMFDVEERMTYVNDRFCELLGYRREELIGTKPFAYLNETNTVIVREQLDRRRQLENSAYELVINRKDGQIIHLLSLGSPMLDKEGSYQGGFAVVTDITVQKQAEATLRQALTKEKELGELKSRFVSVASHEFRTPLATISATTETLLAYRDRLDGSQLNARLHKILAQVDHMKAIMDDVLQLARIQAGRVELMLAPGDLNALCSEIIAEFRSQVEYSERISYTVVGSPTGYRFDVRLMRHVVSNLIANGLKYSPQAQPITVQLHWAAQSVTLQVQDHGIGIPTADLPHLFEPFHRASNVGTISGTGLGLSITKEAVERHGGSIQIETEINSGSTFTVTLPSTPERRTTDVEGPDYR